MNEGVIEREVAAFLMSCTTASLATVDEHREAHACNVWYAGTPDLRVYFVSSPASAHATHIAQNPAVALTVYAHVSVPADIHGLQMHGRCVVVEDEGARREAMAVYAARYPAIAANEIFLKRIVAERFYCVTPSWWRWIDNRRGFGFRVERRVGD